MSNDAEKQIEVLRALAQLQGVTKDSGFDYDKYLKKPIPRIALIWFVMSGAAFAVSFFTAALLLLLASGLMTPKETAEQMKGYIQKQSN